MKQTIFILIVTVAICIVGYRAEGTESTDSDKGPETITLTSEKGKKPANFPHWAHQERLDCVFCHENPAFPTEWTKQTGHDTCKECHKKADAPTKCSTCHPKKERAAYEGC